jgi:hypothetical protein
VNFFYTFPKITISYLSFSIDDEIFPYIRVKGKGSLTILEDPKRTVSEGEKIV